MGVACHPAMPIEFGAIGRLPRARDSHHLPPRHDLGSTSSCERALVQRSREYHPRRAEFYPNLTNRPKHSRTKKKNMVATKVSLQDLLASSCKPTRASAVCGKFNSVSGYACRLCMLVISLLPRGTWGNGSPGERPPGGRVLGKPNSFPGGTFPWGTFPRGTMNKPVLLPLLHRTKRIPSRATKHVKLPAKCPLPMAMASSSKKMQKLLHHHQCPQ